MNEQIGLANVHGYGKVVIPSDVRKYLNIDDGDKVGFFKEADGRIYIENMNPKKTGKYQVTR